MKGYFKAIFLGRVSKNIKIKIPKRIVSIIFSKSLSNFKISKVRVEKIDEERVLLSVFVPTIVIIITPGKSRIFSITFFLSFLKGYLKAFSSDKVKKAVSVPDARKERERDKIKRIKLISIIILVHSKGLFPFPSFFLLLKDFYGHIPLYDKNYELLI